MCALGIFPKNTECATALEYEPRFTTFLVTTWHSTVLSYLSPTLFPLSRFFSANQCFCWAHADSFLTLTVLRIPKLLIFWAHADTLKS